MSQAPIDRFLGPGATAGGPFALLGIGSDDASAEVVTAALAERLARVDAHAHADTPDADEVRLALHASAAQLLDPVMAARMRERWGRATRSVPTPDQPHPPPHPGGLPTPPQNAPPSLVVPVAFHRDVLLTVAHAGGWKTGLAPRVARLARAHGLPPSAAVAAVRMLGRARTSPAPHPLTGSPRGNEPRSLQPSVPARRVPLDPTAAPGSRPAVTLLGLGLAVVLLIVSLGVALVVLPRALQRGSTPQPPPPVVDPQPVAEREPAPARAAESARPAAARRDPLSAIAGASAMLDTDPGAATEGFAATIQALAREWPELDPGSRRAANTAVLEFLFLASRRSGVGMPAVRAVAAAAREFAEAQGPVAPEAVWPTAWSIGMLARLVGERNLLVSMSQEADATLALSLGDAAPTRPLAGFEAGILLGLHAMTARMMPPQDSPDHATASTATREAWVRWGSALDAAAGDDTRVATRARLAALDRLLTEGPDVAQSEALREIVRRLVIACSWRDDAPSRRWLVSALQDTRYTADDLQAVTLPLVTESAAPGVDTSMVARRGMGADDRRALALRYREAWRLGDRDAEDQTAARWDTLSATLAEPLPDDARESAHLRRAAALAHLSAAAAWRWRGDPERAALSLDQAEALAAGPAPITTAEPAAWTPSASRGEWAMRYLAAPPDSESRLAVMRARGAGPVEDAIDAEVLALEAVRGATPALRQAAADALRTASTPAAMHALLELAPTLPRTAMVSELVADVTITPRLASDDPQWRYKVRQRLVGALLEKLAADSAAEADVLAREIAGACLQRADASGEGSVAGPADPLRAAALERAQWRRLAAAGESEPALSSRLARADRRAAGRREVADGPVQRFAAEQVSSLEAMAIALLVERPELGPSIDGVLATHAAARREAREICAQIAATELAVARLWALRLGRSAGEAT